MRFFGRGVSNVDLEELEGKLIVIEGLDGSGRSTQIGLLTEWLEEMGYATANVGLRRSNLVSDEISKAKEGNILGRLTFALFYATDFADQLENVIIPNLKAGAIVLADRYIYTPIARGIVRGLDREWLDNMYQIALVPDMVFYLMVDSQIQIERNLEEKGELDYWESGMDIKLSEDVFNGFVKYQKLMKEEFDRMSEENGFIEIDGNPSIDMVQKDLREHIKRYLETES